MLKSYLLKIKYKVNLPGTLVGIVASVASKRWLCPSVLTAITPNIYSVPSINPVAVKVVVFSSTVPALDQTVLPTVLYSIM